MAPILLSDERIPRRTLGHDMESFFAVIVWIATLDYENEAAFRAKPLVRILLNPKADRENIVYAKENWFKNPENFAIKIIRYFEPGYRENIRFLMCLTKLREVLYPVGQFDFNAFVRSGFGKNNNKKMGDTDPMKEGLFRMCMKEIDDYLNETKGCDEMNWIDSQRTLESQQSQ
jgi:hypothetical protein